MKKQIIHMLVATTFLGFFAASVSADDISQQVGHRGMYLSFLLTPLVYGYGVNSDKKLDGEVGLFPFALQASVGYQFNQYVAAEATGFTMIILNAPTLDAKFILPIGQSVNLYTKAGIGGVLLNDDGDNAGSYVGPYAAVGMGFQVTQHMDLNVEASSYFIKGDGGDEMDAVGSAGIGVTYHF